MVAILAFHVFERWYQDLNSLQFTPDVYITPTLPRKEVTRCYFLIFDPKYESLEDMLLKPSI